jgi:hypothetical protein
VAKFYAKTAIKKFTIKEKDYFIKGLSSELMQIKIKRKKIALKALTKQSKNPQGLLSAR